MVAASVSKGQEGLMSCGRRLGCLGGCFQVLPPEASPGLPAIWPPRSQPPTQNRLQGRPALSVHVPAVPTASLRVCATCAGLRDPLAQDQTSSRPLGPAKAGCRGRSQRPAPDLAHLPGAWEGGTGLEWTQSSPPQSHRGTLSLVHLSTRSPLAKVANDQKL